jgi:hypothetical protein
MRRLSGWGAPRLVWGVAALRCDAPRLVWGVSALRCGVPMGRSEAGVGRRGVVVPPHGVRQMHTRTGDARYRRPNWAVQPSDRTSGARSGDKAPRFPHRSGSPPSQCAFDARRAGRAPCTGASGALGPAQEVSSWRRAFGSRRGLDRRSGSAAPGLSGRRRARQPPDSVAAGVGSTAARARQPPDSVAAGVGSTAARARQPPDSVAAGVGSTAARAQEPAGSATGVGSAAPGLSGRRPRLPCGGPR